MSSNWAGRLEVSSYWGDRLATPDGNSGTGFWKITQVREKPFPSRNFPILLQITV